MNTYMWELQDLNFDEEKWILNLWHNPPAKRRFLVLPKVYNNTNANPILLQNNKIGSHTIEISTFLPKECENSFREFNSKFTIYDNWDGYEHACHFINGEFIKGDTPYGKVRAMETFRYALNQYFCRFVSDFAGSNLKNLITDSNLSQSHINAVKDLWKD
jgi:hypothetical protein